MLQSPRVKFFYLLFFMLLASLADSEAQGKKRYILYATLLDDTPVELSDGANWMMDKGDSFPLLMFKDEQTAVVLQLAGANFRVETKRVRITEAKDVTPAMVANYRQNVQTYIESRSEKIQKELRPGPKKPGPGEAAFQPPSEKK